MVDFPLPVRGIVSPHGRMSTDTSSLSSLSDTSPLEEDCELASKSDPLPPAQQTPIEPGNETATERIASILESTSSSKQRRRWKQHLHIENGTVMVDNRTGMAVEFLLGSAKSKKQQKSGTERFKTSSQTSVDEEPRMTAKRAAKRSKTQTKTKATTDFDLESREAEKAETAVVKVKRKRKTKKEIEAEAMPLAARSSGVKVFIGAHVSSAGGVHNAITNSVHIGGNAFALFLKSQRKWANPPLQEDHSTMFKSNCASHKYDSARHVVPHGSYLVNLAHTDPTRAGQAYEAFMDDLSRCDTLGICNFNFHPGNFSTSTREEGIKQLARQLNRAHRDSSSGKVVTLLETMATRGNTIGGTFEDLKAVLDLVDNSDRVGVCLDTCHVFAAGYDLRSPEAFEQTINNFDKVIGLKYLRAIHVNDSKAPLRSYRDLHANIGTGFLGLRAFHNLMNESRIWGLPLVLETPIETTNAEGKKVDDKGIWAREIKLLESLVGMDPECEEFRKLESDLAAQGESERARIQDQVDRRDEKAKSKSGKKRKRKDSAPEKTSEDESN